MFISILLINFSKNNMCNFLCIFTSFELSPPIKNIFFNNWLKYQKNYIQRVRQIILQKGNFFRIDLMLITLKKSDFNFTKVHSNSFLL